MRPLGTPAAVRIGARRRLPRFVFDFIDGGAGDESGQSRNRAMLDAARLLPSALSGCNAPDMSVALFGRSWPAPIGISPMGLANLVAPGTDLAIAHAATTRGVPYSLSMAGTTALEPIATIAGSGLWMQIYVGRDPAIADDVIRRAEGAGAGALILTVDTPTPGRRPRDAVNGFAFPPRFEPRTMLDVARRPGWLLAMARGGIPTFATLAPYASRMPGGSLVELMRTQSSAIDWRTVAGVRQRWAGPLIVKGLLSPADAVRAKGAGADAIVVSNHGGRQLASLPAPIEMLPAIRDGVGAAFPILADSGVTCGEDVAKLISGGADLCLVGKAMLFACAARGLGTGPGALLDTLIEELRGAMIQLGAADLQALRGSRLATSPSGG